MNVYHHGDLKRALLDAAIDKLRTTDARELSLRDLAKTVGVSTGAPYRHFPSKDALEQSIAREGFARLVAQFQQVSVDAPEPFGPIQTIVRAFFAFERANPGHYKLMFQSPASRAHQDDEQGPAYQALAILNDAIRTAAPGRSDAEIRAQSILLSSALHGLIEMNRAGPFTRLADAELEQLGLQACQKLIAP